MTQSMITSVETWLLDLPLPTPVSLGGWEVRRREYVVVRLSTATGGYGVSYSLSRKAPIDACVHDLIAPQLLGQVLSSNPDVAALMAFSAPSLQPIGILGRAISVVDNCLWDLKASAAGVPLWRVLDPDSSAQPIELLIAEGYARKDEPTEAVAERILARAEQGVRHVKVMLQRDWKDTTSLLELLRSNDPELQVVVDCAWAFPDLPSALEGTQGWSELELGWVEDVFHAHDSVAIAEFRKRSGCRVAIGDEATIRTDLEALVSAGSIDVLRLDSTTIGGLGVAHDLGKIALAAGLSVSPHIYPETHRHLALSFGSSTPVEAMPADRDFGLEHLFVVSDLLGDLVDGRIVAPTAPGIGLDLDWDFIESNTVRHRVTMLEGSQ